MFYDERDLLRGLDDWMAGGGSVAASGCRPTVYSDTQRSCC